VYAAYTLGSCVWTDWAGTSFSPVSLGQNVS